MFLFNEEINTNQEIKIILVFNNIIFNTLLPIDRKVPTKGIFYFE